MRSLDGPFIYEIFELRDEDTPGGKDGEFRDKSSNSSTVSALGRGARGTARDLETPVTGSSVFNSK